MADAVVDEAPRRLHGEVGWVVIVAVDAAPCMIVGSRGLGVGNVKQSWHSESGGSWIGGEGWDDSVFRSISTVRPNP